MSRSTKSSAFPDVNVWIALTFRKHEHHSAAKEWFLEQDCQVLFSRITQLGLLRLLTTEIVMAESVCSQAEAWKVYDKFCQDDRVSLMSEPTGFQESFRRKTQNRGASPKDWADSYLAAFAETAGLTLVTFDRAFRTRKDIDSLILGA